MEKNLPFSQEDVGIDICESLQSGKTFSSHKHCYSINALSYTKAFCYLAEFLLLSLP